MRVSTHRPNRTLRLGCLGVLAVAISLAPAAPALASDDIEQLPASGSAIDPWADEDPWAEPADEDEFEASSTESGASTFSAQTSSTGFVSLPSGAEPFRIVGGGWGHGIGMSQYGAMAMAQQGHTHAQILTHYHRGTSVASKTMPKSFRVGLLSRNWGSSATANRNAVHFPNMTITAVDGPIRWQTCVTRTGSCTNVVELQEAGEKWVAGYASGRLVLRNADGERFVDSSSPTFLRARLGTGTSPKRVQLNRKQDWTYRWGNLEIRKPLSGYDGIRTTIHFNGATEFEKYIYGIAEVPFSWPAQALQAQAVAARSYAVARSMSLRNICDCVLTDGPENQVYHGAQKELTSVGQNWRNAVNATAGRVLTYGGSPIATFYSSSHNKRSENVEDVWVTPQPYHRSVNDPYSGTSANPFRSWTVAPANSTLAKRVSGISVVTYVRIVERTQGGTPTRLEVHGRDSSGNQVVRELTSSNKNIGLDLKSWHSLRSAQIDHLTFSTFTDVRAHRYRSHVYDIARIQRAGLTTGCTSTRYCPDRDLRRGEMAAFLWRIAKQPQPSKRHSFPDVSPSDYYDTAVSWLVENGITDGYGNTGRYEPDLAVTRGQMAAFLWRLAGEPPPKTRHSFNDVSAKSYYDKAVSWLAENDITQGSGSDGGYEPNRDVTRAQMASFIARFLQVVA